MGIAAARRMTSATGRHSGAELACRQAVTGLERVQQPQLDRVDLERRGEPVHLRLAREAGLDGAEAAHRAAGRVVRVDDRSDEVALSTR